MLKKLSFFFSMLIFAIVFLLPENVSASDLSPAWSSSFSNNYWFGNSDSSSFVKVCQKISSSSDYNLGTISFSVNKSSNPAGDIVVDIMTGSCGGTLLTSSVTVSSSSLLQSCNPNTACLVDFNFTGGYTLLANQNYYFVIKRVNGNASNYWIGTADIPGVQDAYKYSSGAWSILNSQWINNLYYQVAGYTPLDGSVIPQALYPAGGSFPNNSVNFRGAYYDSSNSAHYLNFIVRNESTLNTQILTANLPASGTNMNFSVNFDLLPATYSLRSAWLGDSDNALNLNVFPAGSNNWTENNIFTIGNVLPSPSPMPSVPPDYCSSIDNTLGLATICGFFVPPSDYFSSKISGLQTSAQNAFPFYFQIKDLISNGMTSIANASTSAPSFGSWHNVQIVNFSAIDPYMATFRGWLSVFIWLITLAFIFKKTQTILNS